MAHAAVAGAAVGAWWMAALPGSGIAAIVLVLVAMTARHPLLVAVAMVAFTSFLGQRALAGLHPAEPGPVDGWLTLLDDPRPLGPIGIRFTAHLDGKRVAVSAHGPAAGRLDDLLAGEQVRVIGSIRPVRDDDDWARWRHEVGRVTVESVVDHRAGSPVARLANRIRRTLDSGSAALDRSDRAVFLGMVIGDDRAQTAAIADDFRAAGLGHLLVVSGQNVAFVLAVFAPLVAGFRPGPRLVALCLVLLGFAVVTRFEPSVLRAVAMAGVGIGSAALGSPIDGRRGLSWAIVGLLIIDPFLVHVLAFQLSAAATAGIVWLSGPLAERLRGPAWFTIPFATTVGAQLAVSPLLLATFGPLPLASLPANLLAGPVSGPVMVWGSTAGLAAGLLGSSVANILHTPTALMVWWIRSVAVIAARGPQATLGSASLGVLGLVVGVSLWGKHRMRLGSVLVALVVLFASIRAAPYPEPGFSALGGGVDLWRVGGSSVVLLDDPRTPRAVLETLRLVGVGRPDLVVATDGDAADAFSVLALTDRFGPLLILAPPLHRVPGARTVRVGDRVGTGTLIVIIDAIEPEIRVTVIPAPAASAVSSSG